MRGRVGARWLAASGNRELGDSAGAGEAIEREQTALMEQQHPVGDVTHSRELVGRDDRGRRSGAWLANERWSSPVATQAQLIVDEEQVVCAWTELMHLLRSDQ